MAAPPVETEQIVALGAQRLRVRVRPGHGAPRPPLLLMNGIGAALEGLQPFVDALSPATEVVRFDAPGAGGSSTPARPYLLAGLARQVAQMLDALGHRRVDVLGISWGGALAQHFAVQHPNRCRRLVLVSTSTGWMSVPGRPRILLELARPRRHRDPDHLARVAPVIYGGVARTRPDLARLAARGPAPTRKGYAYQQLALVGWTSLPFLRLIKQPTLVLGGTDDPLVPAVNARLLARRIPNARLHLFDDGHLGLLTSAAALAPVVEAFLTRDA